MVPIRLWLIVSVLAGAPALALGQAISHPDWRVGYALSGGASYLSGTTLAKSVHLGGEAAVAMTDSQWRIGGKAFWSRSEGETTSENVTVLFVQESRHRWSGNTWFWEKLSVFPALRSGDSVRGSVESGLAIALTRLFHVNVGIMQSYDSAAGWSKGDTRFVTGIAMKID